MKRWIAILALFTLAALVPTHIRAQVAQSAASPTPDPTVYNDPAIHLRVPSGFVLVAHHPLAIGDLSKTPAITAIWLRLKPIPEKITLAVAADAERPDAWASTFMGMMRSQGSGVFAKSEPIALRNRMPAFLVTITFGSGFSRQTQYFVVWSDGVRGVVFGIAGPRDEVTKEQAKDALTDVRAVLYPLNQP